MDTTGMSQFQCWNLGDRDTEKLKALLSHANKYESFEMRQALEKDGLKGWWYGAYQTSEERFMAAAYITDTMVYLYGTDKLAIRCIGHNLGRNSQRSESKSHSLFGSDDVVRAFWSGFEISGKKVMLDVLLSLYELTEIACKQNDAYAVRFAEKKDLPLVFDFLGEALIDELGMDVRRMGKESHEKACLDKILQQQIILGYHRGQPAFLGNHIETALGLYLEHAHFPVSMRRPKVMRGILARTAELLLSEKGTKVLTYADASNEDLKGALDETGFHVVMTGRLMRLR